MQTRTLVVAALGSIVVAAVVVPFLRQATRPEAAPIVHLAPDSEEPGVPTAHDAELAFDPRTQEATAATALAAYQEFAVYPPWSRPADDSQRHLIDWNGRVESEAGVPFGEDDAPGTLDISLDRFFATTDEPLMATLRIQPADAPHDVKATGEVQVLDDDIAAAEAQDLDTGWRSVHAPQAFSRNGNDPPNVQRLRFSPSQMALANAGQDSRLLVRVERGDLKAVYPLAFKYTGGATPIEIRGLRRDRIRKGSLEVELDVDVRSAGAVLVQAALFDAGDNPIAVYDAYAHPRALGRQTITLVFFGRAIHESGLDGPYRVGALHGHVRGEHGQEFWNAPADLALHTRPYRADEFDAAEWNAPEKRRKIHQYRRFLTALRRGGE